MAAQPLTPQEAAQLAALAARLEELAGAGTHNGKAGWPGLEYAATVFAELAQTLPALLGTPEAYNPEELEHLRPQNEGEGQWYYPTFNGGYTFRESSPGPHFTAWAER